MLVDGRGSIAKVQYTGDEDVQAIKQLLAAVVSRFARRILTSADIL